MPPATRVASSIGSLLPGLAMVAVLAVVARLVSQYLPGSLSEITAGVVAGVLVANTVRLPDAVRPGIRFAVHRLLRIGIVLLGARLSLGAVFETGATAMLVIIACALFAFWCIFLLARFVGVPHRLTVLIAIGTAICGNSAIVATAPIIGAEDQEVSFAVATITIFGVAAVILYPLIGMALGLTDSVFGHWAGVAVNDTSQVTAAGFAYSSAAGDIATIVKLTRNLLIGPALILIGIVAASPRRYEESAGLSLASVGRFVPLFVIGFVAMAAANSLELIPGELGAVIGQATAALILAVLVGVGLGTDLRMLTCVGPKPLYVGLVGAIALSVVGLLAANLLLG